jgi:hypothetical protein
MVFHAANVLFPHFKIHDPPYLREPGEMAHYCCLERTLPGKVGFMYLGFLMGLLAFMYMEVRHVFFQNT